VHQPALLSVHCCSSLRTRKLLYTKVYGPGVEQTGVFSTSHSLLPPQAQLTVNLQPVAHLL
jgi:hypothetical protein